MLILHICADFFWKLFLTEDCVQDKPLKYVLYQNFSHVGAEKKQTPHSVVVADHHHKATRCEHFKYDTKNIESS
jgi:hypothetical protein